jgi:hypothetical protein
MEGEKQLSITRRLTKPFREAAARVRPGESIRVIHIHCESQHTYMTSLLPQLQTNIWPMRVRARPQFPLRTLL